MSMFEVTTANFHQEVLQSALPVLVDVTADWCPPCKMIAPIVDELAKKYHDKLRVGKLDSDNYPELSQMLGVMGLPTLILFQNGQVIKFLPGFRPLERIEVRPASGFYMRLDAK